MVDPYCTFGSRGNGERKQVAPPRSCPALRGLLLAEHLRRAGFDLRGGTGVENRQPQKEPHGVMPERLFIARCGVTLDTAANTLSCAEPFEHWCADSPKLVATF